MQFKTLVLSTLAATAVAQNTTLNPVAVLSVLQTALPSSLVAEAITNSNAVSARIASQFAAGSTPAWFSSLPSDIQGYLVPVASSTGMSGTGMSNGTIISSNSTMMSNMTMSMSQTTTSSTGSTSMSMTMSTTTGTSDSTSGSGSSESSTSSQMAAALPTSVIGTGIAGAVGVIGLLAL